MPRANRTRSPIVIAAVGEKPQSPTMLVPCRCAVQLSRSRLSDLVALEASSAVR